MTFAALDAIHIAVVCAAVGMIVTTSELLWAWSRGHYDSSGIWTWAIAKEAYSARAAAALRPLMSNESVLLMLGARVVAAASIPLLYGLGYPAVAPMMMLVAILCFMQLRSRWGGEGGDQMTVLVLIAALVADLAPGRPVVVNSAALFIGAQITLSYLASGTAKLFGPLWRSGGALGEIMNHYTFGHAPFARLLARYPLIGKVMCRGVIAFQITFWVFYLLPMPYALAYPVAGIFFHAGIAYFMRLNLFIPVFIGTYPCLFFTHEFVRGLLFP